MEYGCIGEHLKHSFSKEIHNALADYEYEIKEIPRDGLSEFAEGKDFRAINVTIPYKELIMPYLYKIDKSALEIGSVNTVVNRGGKLYGYNTDLYGMDKLAEKNSISFLGKKVAILGTGGTSKTAYALAKELGARDIIKVSRSGKDGAVSYDVLYRDHTDTEIIINTTPIGMFPEIFGLSADISLFPKLSGVLDAVYNPLRTPLILSALKRGIPAEGGLYMLVAQAVRASEHFLDTVYPNEETDRIFSVICKSKENIVLTGMPASGKSTVGAILSKMLDRRLIDTDELIEKRAGMRIPDIFKTAGEQKFRDIESEVIRDISSENGVIIATGGGAPLRKANVDALKENGRIYFIDRPIESLIPTADRPTASTADAIRQRYCERIDIYRASADRIINADSSAEEVAESIRASFFELP